MRYRIGLVGLHQAREFINIFNALPEAQVTALCDIDAALLKKVSEQNNISACFTDFEKFLNSDVDIVVLSTPIPEHGSQSIAALQANKHVLCQYIAANTPKQAYELIAVARASSKKYMMIETDCYQRQNQVMAALAAKGVFGELTMGRGHYIHDCKGLARNSDNSWTWRGNLYRSCNGGYSAAVHTALPLLKIFGERIQEVYSYGPGARTTPEYKWHDRITTVGKLASGRIVEMVVDVQSWHTLTCGYCLKGTRGHFDFNQGCFVENGRLSSPKGLNELIHQYELDLNDISLGEEHSSHTLQWSDIIKQFMHSIKTDSTPTENLQDALHITAIGWAATESLDSGKSVKVLNFESV